MTAYICINRQIKSQKIAFAHKQSVQGIIRWFEVKMGGGVYKLSLV